MKKTKRLWALLLAMVMALGLISTAFAAPTIDSGRKASLSLYKYDITAASADGAWDAASYVSTGVQDDAVADKLAKYAIQGVEFSYLRVADIAMNNELVDGQRQVGVLYGSAEDTVLQAIGLTNKASWTTSIPSSPSAHIASLSRLIRIYAFMEPICVCPKISFTVSIGTSWFIMELATYLLKL